MKIEILGSGCTTCETLYQNVLQALDQIRPPTPAEVTKINDVNYFTQKGVFMTPGLVVDGEVISAGKLLTVEDIVPKIIERM